MTGIAGANRSGQAWGYVPVGGNEVRWRGEDGGSEHE